MLSHLPNSCGYCIYWIELQKMHWCLCLISLRWRIEFQKYERKVHFVGIFRILFLWQTMSRQWIFLCAFRISWYMPECELVFLVFPCFTNLKLHKHWIWICGRQRQLTYLLFIHVFPVQLCWKTSRTKGELNEKATRGHHDKNGCIGSRIYEEQTTGDDILKSFIAIKFLLKNKIQILI